MHLTAIRIRNFRRLRDVHIELDEETSIFVGANNSGKTSATEAVATFLHGSVERFKMFDFSAAC